MNFGIFNLNFLKKIKLSGYAFKIFSKIKIDHWKFFYETRHR